MKREALADRIITYCDALVAFSLVNGLAFLVALAEPDVRCSIVGVAGAIVAINLIFAIASTVGLITLRRTERRLRGDDLQDAEVEKFWRVVAIARFVLIWFFMGLVLVGVVSASLDPLCA